MTDVPNSTLEAEQDLDYTYGYDYDYGLLDGDLRTIARAVATTEANSLAVGSGSATSTATATTTASTQAIGSGSTTATADAQTTASTTVTATTAVQSVAQATTTATTQLTDATLVNTRVEWRVTRDGEFVEDTVFDVDPVVDTANPFGDYCVIKMDDSEGERFGQYARGTRVDVAVSENAGISFDNRFTGYVVERRETEQSGADVLEVEAYSFDQFLRRNTVTNDQQGNLISEALEDIITTDTPVTYVAANIDVGDEQELTRSYQGEAVETVLRDLAFKSNNEDFGVNDDLEFFFRERETVHIDRGIDNTQWFNYDIPELGKEAINEVEVWFDDGEESVIVDDGTDKLDLQDSLELADPGTQRAELNRPLLTDISDAEDEGRKYLQFRNSTLSGTVTTFGLFDAEPGDTIDIEIQPRGIDEEFVIAAIEYRWGVDETILTIVEKRGDVDDILSELNESVQRVEMEGANRDAPKNRITTTNAGAMISVDVDADGTTPSNTRFVNNGRRAVRDAWTGDDPPDIATLVVGDDGSGLSRSNSELRNQTNSAAVSQSLPDTTSVVFEATITQTGVRELGLETTDGRLITRVVFDSAVDIDGTVSVTLDASNDASVSRGVLTNDGQTAVRDVLADNTPALPNAYAYGDDGTAVAETDTELGNELVETDLDEILIQSADATAAWESIIDSLETGLNIDDSLSMSQINYVRKARSDDGDTFAVVDDFYSGGSARSIRDSTEFLEFEIPVEVDIPSENVQIACIFDSGEDSTDISSDGFTPFRWSINGTPITEATFGGGTFTLSWRDIVGSFDTIGTPPDIEAGETVTVRVEGIEDPPSGEDYNTVIDVVALYDDRFSDQLSFPDDVHEPDGFYDGPELFAEQVVQPLDTAETRRNVTEANFVSSWNDTSGDQYVELANDGSTFTRINNDETGSVEFASPNAGVDTNISLGRFGGPQNETPRFGFNGQSIDSWELFANPDAIFTDDVNATLTRAIVPPDTLASGTTIREAGLKSDGVLLTRHELAEFSVLEGQRVSSSETSRFTGDN